MKNKKLLTRLFALLASLVLVLALSLPCFAEENDQLPTDYIYKRVYNYSDLILLTNSDTFGVPCIVREMFDSEVFVYGQLKYYTDGFFSISWTFYGADQYYYTLRFLADNLLLTVVTFDQSGNQTSESHNLTWDDVSIFILVPVSSSSADSTTPSSDMYSNLFNILKDAVYGSDAELTGSQEYALTLISTILTYATILLPVILVIFIAVWCFKRF